MFTEKLGKVNKTKKQQTKSSLTLAAFKTLYGHKKVRHEHERYITLIYIGIALILSNVRTNKKTIMVGLTQ